SSDLVGLKAEQKQLLTDKKRRSQLKGALTRRNKRRETTSKIYTEAIDNVGTLTSREKFLIGTALYWAEGSKEHLSTIGQGVDFGNTDVNMVKFFVRYLIDVLKVDERDLIFSIYIHENSRKRAAEVVSYWKKQIGTKNFSVQYIYYKKHNPKTIRKNVGESYYGTLRVRVRRSSTLQRKISGWIYGITGATWRIV